jgi:hypothetical protein
MAIYKEEEKLEGQHKAVAEWNVELYDGRRRYLL